LKLTIFRSFLLSTGPVPAITNCTLIVLKPNKLNNLYELKETDKENVKASQFYNNHLLHDRQLLSKSDAIEMVKQKLKALY